MPNWNDSSDIAKYLKAHPDTVVVERRRPSQEAKEKPKAEPSKRDPHYERPAQKQGQAVLPKPRPESTYKAPERPEIRKYTEWDRRWNEAVPERNDEELPYTNYQALPEFVTKQRRNPAGGYAGIKESFHFSPVAYGTLSPPELSSEEISASLYGNTTAPSVRPPSTYIDLQNPPWRNEPGVAQLQMQYPQWRKTDDLWHRIRDADIVPAGQATPLGGQMHPGYGPEPESTYFAGNAQVPLDYWLKPWATYNSETYRPEAITYYG
jgi:hypothetical protein